MVWACIAANIFVVGCSIFWLLEARKALIRAREMVQRAVMLSNLVRRAIELSDETINNVEENNIDHEEDC